MARPKKKKIVYWTSEEEERLLKNIENNVTNLTKAFELTSKEVQRSPGACAAHWYDKVSTRNGVCLFLTVSGKHVTINRKNGKGQQSTLPVFKKILALFGLTY